MYKNIAEGTEHNTSLDIHMLFDVMINLVMAVAKNIKDEEFMRRFVLYQVELILQSWPVSLAGLEGQQPHLPLAYCTMPHAFGYMSESYKGTGLSRLIGRFTFA